MVTECIGRWWSKRGPSTIADRADYRYVIDVAAYVEAARRFPIFNSIFKRFIPQVYIDARKWHVAWSKEQTLRSVDQSQNQTA